MAGWSAQVALTGRLPGGPLDVPADATADQGEILMTSNDPVHSESEAHSWTIDVAHHPTRQDSPEYVAARQKMTEIAGQQPAGVHHYPTPVADIQLVKYDDFQLWVTDGEGNPAAVAPWPSAAAEMPASTCSTPRQGRSWPGKSKRLKAPISR
jgi:hypothetical protein